MSTIFDPDNVAPVEWLVAESEALSGSKALVDALNERFGELAARLQPLLAANGPLQAVLSQLGPAVDRVRSAPGKRDPDFERLQGTLVTATRALDDLHIARHVVDRLLRETAGGRADVDFHQLADQQAFIQAVASVVRRAYDAFAPLLSPAIGVNEQMGSAAGRALFSESVEVPDHQTATGHDLAGNRWTIRIRDGRLWYDSGTELVMLPPWGVPQRGGLYAPSFRAPKSLVSCTGDGPMLAVEDDSGVVHTAIVLDGVESLQWRGPWGELPYAVPGWIRRPEGARHLVVSHRGPCLGWQDPRGITHDAGSRASARAVITLYALSADGREVRFSDARYGGEFEQWFASPEDGDVPLVTIAASASMVMGLDASGSIWTRPYDFDQAGHSRSYPYAYQTSGAPPYLWSQGGEMLPAIQLPAAGWTRHASIDLRGGVLTGAIAIVVDKGAGEGNAARELRVEGHDPTGAGGYWRKPITASQWTFVQNHRTSAGASDPTGDRQLRWPLVPDTHCGRGSERRLVSDTNCGRAGARYENRQIVIEHCRATIAVAVDFDPRADTHAVRLDVMARDGATQPYRLTLYTRAARKTDGTFDAYGLLAIPDAIFVADDPGSREVAARVFQQHNLWDVRVEERDGRLRISPLAGIAAAHPCRQEIDWTLTR